jgi:flavin reductase (DIM6/NTAB) family NADH-FMN oxidoreductase RutF
MVKQVRKAIKALVFGSASFPQQCSIGLRDPQSEIGVWLHGLGPPRDVTQNNVFAAARPFTIGIGLERPLDPAEAGGTPLSLQFRERDGEQRLLGVIRLRLKEITAIGIDQLGFFEILGCTNYCVPRARLWARYAQYGYQRWRSRTHPGSNVPMVVRELHSVFVFYICPRPVVLVSVVDGNLTNIFPMDLIGPVGTRHFSLALHSTSTAVPLLERSRRIALSSVPLEQTSVAYQLGRNHNKASIEADEIPFATTKSAAFGLPVPSFALRVREMQIESIQKLGSHRLFLAHAVEDRHLTEGLQLFFVHGFYQAWRCRQRPGLLVG